MAAHRDNMHCQHPMINDVMNESSMMSSMMLPICNTSLLTMLPTGIIKHMHVYQCPVKSKEYILTHFSLASTAATSYTILTQKKPTGQESYPTCSTMQIISSIKPSSAWEGWRWNFEMTFLGFGLWLLQTCQSLTCAISSLTSANVLPKARVISAIAPWSSRACRKKCQNQM